ncbi:hypothetical protein BKA70DRAFT_1430616 [Coprinopsis sp. MPI-PUGE-AT-0042]|nr:hypothetical protein BKA70DRAFT_1430616 [Coprinopsis sp. MPI-PUGE-AT-0042]
MTLRTSLLSASFSSSSSTGSLSGYNSPVSSSVSTPTTTSLVCTPSTSVHSDDGREYFDRKAAESFKAEQFFKVHDRVSELWFEDGNLILQAENTFFRIYRSHLSARSTLDGIPIVEVYDEAEDMKNFLKALLDSDVENTPFAALQIASEFGLDWLVPSLVYCISSHDITKTLDSAIWVRPGRRSNKRQVKREDGKKRIYLAARNKLLLIQNAHALSIVRHHRPSLTADSPKCTGEEDKCHRTRLRIVDILTRWGTAGFLDFFDEQYEAFAGDFCEVCGKDFKSTHAKAVQELWDILPKTVERELVSGLFSVGVDV